jgi:hypothetical protein
MLDDCAPGNTRKQYTHSWKIEWKRHCFPRLPLGAHGRRRRTNQAEIELGHVRQMARQFGIVDCARRFIPQLQH